MNLVLGASNHMMVFGGDGVGLVAVVALRCDMDNWAGLVDVGNLVSKRKQIDEDSSEESINVSDGVVVEEEAS